MALDFPTSPTNGQQYTLNGVTYYYDATSGSWLTTYVTTLSFANVSENQVVFVNSNQANGSLGLTYDRTNSRLSANSANIGILNVSGFMVFSNTVNISGATTISNTITVTGNTTLANVSVSGNLSIARVNTVANNSFGTSGQVLTSNGSGNVYWSPVSGALVSYNVYTSTQTITIPANATRAMVELIGGGGGGSTYGSSSAAGGNGGGLRKFLSDITPGLTLALTIGTAGGSGGTSGSAGSNTTLSSGTQSITTLTAERGLGAGNDGCSTAIDGIGGRGFNGDINIQSGPNTPENIYPYGAYLRVTPFGLPYGYGGSNMVGGYSGSAGVCVITWFR